MCCYVMWGNMSESDTTWSCYYLPCCAGYNSESSLYGVSQQQAPRSVYLLILVLDEPGDLLQHLYAERGGYTPRQQVYQLMVYNPAAVPSHSASPYRGRWCKRWDKPGSPPGKTSPPASLLLHTGCLKFGWSPQTAACQSETQHSSMLKALSCTTESAVITHSFTVNVPLTPAPRGTWSGTCRWFLSCSLSGWTPWRRQLAAGGPASCGSGHGSTGCTTLCWVVLIPVWEAGIVVSTVKLAYTSTKEMSI